MPADWTRADGRPTLIGVVHLLPLPGSARSSPGLDEVCARAEADAHTLREGGADGLILENFGDVPFAAGRVPPFTVAAMTRLALAVRTSAPGLHLGINVLRNDALAALSVAAAAGAAFIRVNVHTGAMVTDQGLVQGDAQATLLERNRLGARVGVAADVLVKHAVPLGAVSLEDAARDTYHRGLADVLIVTGTGTGQPTAPEHVARVRRAVPEAQVWVGSGATPQTAASLAADGYIVGTWLHRTGDLSQPLDPERVRQMRNAL